LNTQPVVVPANPDVTIQRNVPLTTLRQYIDWTPFFLSWELRGRYPEIFDDAAVGVEAKKLFDDANALLDTIVANESIRVHAVSGMFPALREGDDVSLGDSGKLHFLRQQTVKAPGLPNLSLADFIRTREELPSGQTDFIGAFVVTAGDGVDELCEKYERMHDDYSSIMVKAIADRLAEAAAEWLHQYVRTTQWGYDQHETLTNNDLILENYNGIRPAPGYPACPDHTEKLTLFRLLNAEEHIGVSLTESMAMSPASSVSGWYFAQDYAMRKGWTLQEAERWLAPLL
jgi:5-methyltetrahydrofolate--homocysteine methyltransferase